MEFNYLSRNSAPVSTLHCWYLPNNQLRSLQVTQSLQQIGRANVVHVFAGIYAASSLETPTKTICTVQEKTRILTAIPLLGFQSDPLSEARPPRRVSRNNGLVGQWAAHRHIHHHRRRCRVPESGRWRLGRHECSGGVPVAGPVAPPVYGVLDKVQLLARAGGQTNHVVGAELLIPLADLEYQRVGDALCLHVGDELFQQLGSHALLVRPRPGVETEDGVLPVAE